MHGKFSFDLEKGIFLNYVYAFYLQTFYRFIHSFVLKLINVIKKIQLKLCNMSTQELMEANDFLFI